VLQVKVEGVEAVVKMLREYRGKKANAALRKGTRSGCKIIAARAKQLIPAVQRKDRAGVVSIGRLRKAVNVRAIKRNRKGWIGSQVVIDGGGLGYTGDEFYGAFVEFGTKRMKAREYFKTAAKETESAAGDEARKVIVAELSK
jgi:HK97 gp10 family phage protein